MYICELLGNQILQTLRSTRFVYIKHYRFIFRAKIIQRCINNL